LYAITAAAGKHRRPTIALFDEAIAAKEDGDVSWPRSCGRSCLEALDNGRDVPHNRESCETTMRD
jgi:hypothetical protein